MKQRWKLLPAILAALVLVLAGLAWSQRENLKIVWNSLRYSQTELEQQMEDNQKIIRDAVEAAPGVSVRDVTEEERQALGDGSMTREELTESLLNTGIQGQIHIITIDRRHGFFFHARKNIAVFIHLIDTFSILSGKITVQIQFQPHLADRRSVFIRNGITNQIGSKCMVRIQTLNGICKLNTRQLKCLDFIFCIFGKVSSGIAKLCLIYILTQ